MITPRFVVRYPRLALAIALGAMVLSLPGCMGTTVARFPASVVWRTDEQVRLPEAEQMIDELDRLMTANGTIGVKSPDVWGQDRLAKFRSEYEIQMSAWLKTNYKSEINASVRRGEAEAKRLSIGSVMTDEASKATLTSASIPSAEALAKSVSDANTAALAAMPAADKANAALEPTVILDEHSNYLNHLNQLRRINAGDDLTDRPGYGLYLVRIPVTLSPGPRSRRGKGAIITVSAKSQMTRDTMRNTLRNVVINETVNNLTQAVRGQFNDDAEPSLGSGATTFSLISFADTEVYYGDENIRLLRTVAENQLQRDLADEPHHRSARVAEWLRGELEASYQALEDSIAPQRVGQKISATDPLEPIGDLIESRSFAKVASLQPNRRVGDPQVLRAGMKQNETIALDPITQRKQVTDFILFALRIQAAAVNRRLKHDMIDQDPTLNQQNLQGTSFFDPKVPEEVIRIFEKYVDAKWPLRVYSIEPVIAQQNVADAFSRRTQSAIDLAATAPIGPLKVLSDLATVSLAAERRTAEDESAIRLNPTMVGFGAGQSTFGWVFYPRLQTRQKEGRFLTNAALLLNGHLPETIGKEQSIEPGQRECTALIVMPNFVPKIEFITVANWFRTSEVGEGQKSDLEKSSTLARKLVTTENALHRAKIEGQYRPEEYQIAMERLAQLKSLMPTQRLIVRVPFSNDNTDSRIFCSQGGQLRPSLLSWHGRPPQQGEDSTILVEGRNFSVHDTHVIAGGKPAVAVLVSRNILEVTISKEALPAPSASGTPLLDLSVATPNGVSNHLLIRMDQPRSEAMRLDPKSLTDNPAPQLPAPITPAAELPVKLEGLPQSEGASPPIAPQPPREISPPKNHPPQPPG